MKYEMREATFLGRRPASAAMADFDDAVPPAPPWANSIRGPTRSEGVPSLQVLLCQFLAQHLQSLEILEDLPPHLSEIVSDSIRGDRSLLSDGSLAVWLEANCEASDAVQLSLRWAACMTDVGLRVLVSEGWAGRLTSLDLGYVEKISDAGITALCPELRCLKTLILTGCTACGDAACEAIGRHLSSLEAVELEVLPRVTDRGTQAIVRGCNASLTSLRVGGCSQLSSVTTSLIADHCKRSTPHAAAFEPSV